MSKSLPLVALRLVMGWCLGTALGSVVEGASSDFPSQIPSYAQSLALREDATLHSVAFNSEGLGITCGDRGTILRTTDGGASWQACESGLDCSLQSVQWVASNRAVIVGGARDRITGISRGIVLISEDAGQTWTRCADQELPRLRTLAWEEDRLVASGDWSDALLTNRFESRDRGRTWNAGFGDPLAGSRSPGSRSPGASELFRWVEATGTPVAVRHACRISDNALCAVGDHGTILISRDRGQSWAAARGEGRQTAILIVAKEAASLPWALLGSETLESRNRVAVVVQNASEPVNAGDPNRLDLAKQAVVALGGSGADPFAVSQENPALLATQWIAIHRPAVVVLDSFLEEEIHTAFFNAATAGGVGRVIRYSLGVPGNASATSEMTIHHESLLTKCGILACDLQADAMHWVDPFQVDSKSIHLHWLYNSAAGARRGESLVSGIAITEGRQLAAPSPVASRRKLQIAQARMNQSTRTAQLIERSRSVEQFSSSLRQLLDLTGKEDQFRLAWSTLVETLPQDLSLRNLAFHEAALDEFANRFRGTTAGQWAALRHDVIRNSLEWKRLRSLLSETASTVQPIPVVESVAVSPFQVAGGGVRQASGIAPLVVPKPETINLNRREQPNELTVDLNWEFHPPVLFAREAARQRNDEGLLQTTDEGSANLSRLADSDHPWSEMLRRDGAHVILAHRATTPPRLDGIIQDSCWQNCTTGAGDDAPIRFAYDDDYVYVAVTCAVNQFRTETRTAQTSPSVRDQDLSGVDRLGVWIDIDRDLMSSMQLQVSEAGRVHDAIDGNAAWQPTWYPAIRRDAQGLTFEIAILRHDLAELPIIPGESWLVLVKPMAAHQGMPFTISPNPNEWYRISFQP